MGIPDVKQTINDGALGIVPGETDQLALIVGVCSAGTANVIQSFNDKAALVAALGSGPLVDAAAISLDTAGGPVLVARIASTTAGAESAVTHGGTGTAVATVGGAALDAYDVTVTITRAGANLAALTAAFKYTLDGGNSVSQEIAMPVGGVYVVPGTGITITFADGTFVANDTYKFTSTAPSYSLSDLQAALAVILADPRDFAFLHVIGAAASVSAAAAMAAALETIMDSQEQVYRYTFAVMQVPEDTDANIIAAFVAVGTKRVMWCAGSAAVQSTINGLIRKRNSSLAVAARIAQVPIHEDLGRVRTGPITSVISLYRDEQATPGLDAARFATLRTIIGEQGLWVTDGRMGAPAGSDFVRVQYRRVLDKACKVARSALLFYLNDSLRLQTDDDTTPGAIDELEARSIEADVNSQLAAALSGHVSKAYIQVDRTHNITSDSKVPVKVRVQPLGYAKEIDVDIGFENPALQPKSA